MRTKEEQEAIQDCWERKYSQNKASKILGISRSTIKDYYRRLNTGTYPNWKQERDSKSLGLHPCGFDPHRAYQYAYALGFYLGDGCISKGPRAYRLRIFQDARYVKLIKEQQQTLQDLFENNKVSLAKHGENCIAISVYSNALPSLFPQHGKGKKHNRQIVLDDWQKQIVEKHPKAFIKGLIISDGCRFVGKANNQTYEYVNYQFTNYSKDIRDLFVWACTLIGVKTTEYKHCNMIRTRKDVEILEDFIGKKE